ncbi:RtcB family protein [Aeoliella sp. ICT_H6.2]|uniref:3'-phosphate/5'-hydroxy nucleic acid ligase n=1 Tax=Aeoliella straminimaris TaxID=2954799 RepID=A0A9X2JIM8_9BACT|nr:RtcB family protein [Aeoliella straminimaris]MCO6047260.1 RtcB family protein [Aeoliella straminimaris]
MSKATLNTWLTEPLSPEVAQSIERLRSSDDVRHVAVMPDVHLCHDVCIGVVAATESLVYPAAVGGDIGCGMAAVPFDVEAALLESEHAAGTVLRQLYQCVPGNKHRQPRALPDDLSTRHLSDAGLTKIAQREGRVQLGTMGRGNHFLEFQSDQAGRLWLLLHSGSRGIGQAISARHLAAATATNVGLLALNANDEPGQRYLSDVAWARRYAAENRLAMLRTVEEFMQQMFGIGASWPELIHGDHNFVDCEHHFGRQLLVHRKGAQSAQQGEPGIVPGSMGAPSFHTAGRACSESLMSCSHGAGRQLSRSQARRQVNSKHFQRQVGPLWFDRRRLGILLDEAPAAYKDIRQVMRAQRELLRIERELQPVLNYKGP